MFGPLLFYFQSRRAMVIFRLYLKCSGKLQGSLLNVNWMDVSARNQTPNFSLKQMFVYVFIKVCMGKCPCCGCLVNKCMNLWLCVCAPPCVCLCGKAAGLFPSCQWKTLVSCPQKASQHTPTFLIQSINTSSFSLLVSHHISSPASTRAACRNWPGFGFPSKWQKGFKVNNCFFEFYSPKDPLLLYPNATRPHIFFKGNTLHWDGRLWLGQWAALSCWLHLQLISQGVPKKCPAFSASEDRSVCFSNWGRAADDRGEIHLQCKGGKNNEQEFRLKFLPVIMHSPSQMSCMLDQSRQRLWSDTRERCSGIYH